LLLPLPQNELGADYIEFLLDHWPQLLLVARTGGHEMYPTAMIQRKILGITNPHSVKIGNYTLENLLLNCYQEYKIENMMHYEASKFRVAPRRGT